MNHFLRSTGLSLSLIGTLGCGDDAGGEGAPSLAEGESYLSIEVSGEDLDGPLLFEGKTDEIGLFIFDGEISAIASDEIGLESTSGGFHLGRMTLGIRQSTPGTIDESGFDIDLVVQGFHNEHGTSGYSLRERDGASSLTVTSVDENHVKGHFAFDASPTQGQSTHLVYHVKGSFEMRD